MPRLVEVEGNSMIEISREEIENFYLSYLEEAEPLTGLLTDYEKKNRARSFANCILTKPDNTLSDRLLYENPVPYHMEILKEGGIANYAQMAILEGILLKRKKHNKR